MERGRNPGLSLVKSVIGGGRQEVRVRVRTCECAGAVRKKETEPAEDESPGE